MRGPSRRLLWTRGAGRPARPGPRRPVLFLPRHLPARQPPATDLAQSCPDFSLDIESDSVAGVQTGPIGPRSPEGEDAPAGAMQHGPVPDAPRSASRAPAGVRARRRHPPGAGASAGRCRPRPDFVVIQVGARLLDGTREQVTESGAHWLSKEQEPNQRPVSRSVRNKREADGHPGRSFALPRDGPRCLKTGGAPRDGGRGPVIEHEHIFWGPRHVLLLRFHLKPRLPRKLPGSIIT